MQVNEIKCDQCEKDLTYTGNCEDFYLVLGYSSKAPWYTKENLRGGVVTSMAMYPPVDRTYHFCNLNCLDQWRDAKRIKSMRRNRWRDEHREEMGHGWSKVNGTCPNDDALAILYRDSDELKSIIDKILRESVVAPAVIIEALRKAGVLEENARRP